MTINNQTRIYVAACKPERIRRLPGQLKKLDLPYTIERELPRSREENAGYFNAPSQRFRQQIITDVETPLLWLEDDVDIPDNFFEIWGGYEKTLPVDWCAAVIGWGILASDYDDEPKLKRVSPGWWHLTDKASFYGTQAVLFNRGEWRTRLQDEVFRADLGFCTAFRKAGIEQFYHTDTILIGTNDPETTFGDPVILYPKLGKPGYYSWQNGKWGEIKESDFAQ